VAELDKIVHERARLRILTYLATTEQERVSFNELQDSLGFTSGNLSIQLKKLSLAKYVMIHKTFKDNKPYTTVTLTPGGAGALNTYVNEMEQLIGALKH
jgi:DNA-binding MarR family transcriptional regulator